MSKPSEKTSIDIATWWGRHRQSHDRFDLWNIGPLELLIERRESFWRFYWRHVQRDGAHLSTGQNWNSQSPSARTLANRTLSIGDEGIAAFHETAPSSLCAYFPSKMQSMTIPSTSPNEDLIFSPLLPDLPISLALPNPAVLEASEKLMTGFLIPLVLRIDIATASGATREACQIPLTPLARTWLGPSPLHGDVGFCPDTTEIVDRWSTYRPRLDQAGCSVTLVNNAGSSTIARHMTVPAPRLSLFHSPQTGFWCESLTIDISEAAGPKLDRVFPKEAGAPVLIAAPRTYDKVTSPLKSIASFGSTIGSSVENIFKERM